MRFNLKPKVLTFMAIKQLYPARTFLLYSLKWEWILWLYVFTDRFGFEVGVMTKKFRWRVGLYPPILKYNMIPLHEFNKEI